MFSIRAAALAASLAIIAIAGLAPRAVAHAYTVGALSIGHPWTRATAPSAQVAAGYLTIENKGTQPDRLLSATFSGAAAVEVHEMAVEGGVMRMRELPKGIEIKPGQKVELKPGGYHLMFIGLKGGLTAGAKARGVLIFEQAGRLEVEFNVEAMGARGDHGHQGHGAKTH
jgi:periplasmic copper chaperone A